MMEISFNYLPMMTAFPNYEDFDEEVEKLFSLYDTIVIDEDDNIYGEKAGKRELIAPDSFEAYGIALEVLDDGNYE